MYRIYLVGLLVALALAIGCGEDDDKSQEPIPSPDSLEITCPSDTSVPVNCPADPDSLGLYPDIYCTCMAQPALTYRDSLTLGGIRRIWVVQDTCGNADTCIQLIGQGAPGDCN